MLTWIAGVAEEIYRYGAIWAWIAEKRISIHRLFSFIGFVEICKHNSCTFKVHRSEFGIVEVCIPGFGSTEVSFYVKYGSFEVG